ncbi:MAG: hypothetical protein E7019_06875 [Alphaproteobacteria bacterium]|nr:hypothetical protein [Alphaproteobacteria bacterium]
MTRTATYHIIGAGVAGLFCAKLLKNKIKDSHVVVYEAASQAGGRCMSYHDKTLEQKLDNGTHVVIGANKELAKFVDKNEWESNIIFWDANKKSFSDNKKLYKNHILMSVCNTPAEQIAKPILKNILYQTFPWNRSKYNLYFSKQNLSQKIINNLASYADEIKYNSKLIKIESQFGRAAQLNFEKYQVDLKSEDRVILALDNKHYSNLMGQTELAHNSIINISYYTSEKIHFPPNASFLGIVNGIVDWVFVNNNILSVTISAANDENTALPELAKKIWQELDAVRGVNSAFIPPFKAFKHKYATIAQDEKTNELRPDSALTEYPNVVIAGDWTMKNHVCCMETAYLSAKRAVKAIIKSK